MKYITKYFYIIIIAILLSIIIIYKNTQPTSTNTIKIKQKIDTVFVEKTYTKYIKGKDIYQTKIIEKVINIPIKDIDSSKVIKDYFSKHLSQNIITLPDSLGTIEIIDTISQNKIIGRKINSNINQKIIYNTKTIIETKHNNQLHIGISTLSNLSSFMIGPSLLIKTKKDNIYSISAYIDNNLNKNIGFNIYWKIKLK